MVSILLIFIHFPRTLALYLTHIGNPAPETVNNSSIANSRPSFKKVLQLFQSNAKPVTIFNSSLLASTVQQGAGLVNAFQTLRATTVISPSELALNDTVRRAESYTIQVFNIDNQLATYNISHFGAVMATGLQHGNDMLLPQPKYTPDVATVNIQPSTVAIPPGKFANITLEFQAPSSADPALLPIFSGFIRVTNNLNEQVVQVPYAGIVGDYQDASIIVRKSASGVVAGILNSNNSYISSTVLETLNSTKSNRIILVITWSSRLVFVEVVSGENQSVSNSVKSYGYVYNEARRSPAIYTNLVRNTHVSFRSHSQWYELRWSGQVSEIVSNENSSWLETKHLPDGIYKIRFSALKHFGNPRNSSDFDIFETPVFNLVGFFSTTPSSTLGDSTTTGTQVSTAVSALFSSHGAFIFLYFAFLCCSKL